MSKNNDLRSQIAAMQAALSQLLASVEKNIPDEVEYTDNSPRGYIPECVPSVRQCCEEIAHTLNGQTTRDVTEMVHKMRGGIHAPTGVHPVLTDLHFAGFLRRVYISGKLHWFAA